jgi:hypothetical protein
LNREALQIAPSYIEHREGKACFSAKAASFKVGMAQAFKEA